MAMTADEAAAIAASALTTRNVQGVAATYKTWLNAQPTLATAVVALLQAHRTSKNPTRVLAIAAANYGSEEHDPPTITSITPSSAAAGATHAVAIVGTNLTGVTGITVGGTAATGVSASDDKHVAATFPSKTAGSYNVVLTTPDGSVTVTNGMTYV